MKANHHDAEDKHGSDTREREATWRTTREHATDEQADEGDGREEAGVHHVGSCTAADQDLIKVESIRVSVLMLS